MTSLIIAASRSEPVVTVSGGAASLAGTAVVARPGFRLVVDAAKPCELVELVARTDDSEGLAALEAFVEHDVLDAYLASREAQVWRVESTAGAAGRTLSAIAQLALYRDVDHGRRRGLWDAEILARWCDLIALDERFRPIVDANAVAAAFASLLALDRDLQFGRAELSADARESLASLAHRLGEFDDAWRESSDVIGSRLRAERHLLGAVRGFEPPRAASDDLGIMSVPLDRTALPAELLLALDARLTVFRERGRAQIELSGIEQWPVKSNGEFETLYVLGRSPASFKMRTLDEFAPFLDEQGRGLARAAIVVHESDFERSPNLRFEIVNGPGAVRSPLAHEDWVFLLLRSELARLLLVRAESFAEADAQRRREMARQATLVESEIEALASSIGSEGELLDALSAVGATARQLGPITPKVPRRIFG